MSIPVPALEVCRDQKRLLVPIAIGAGMGGFYVTAAGSLIATLSRDLGVSLQSLAGLGSAFGVAMVLSGLLAPWGLRFGPVWYLRLAPLLAVVGTLLLTWSPNVGVALAGTTVAGLAGAMMSSAAAATFTGTRGGKYLSFSVGVASLVSIATTVLFALVERLAPGHGRLTVWFVMLAVVPTLCFGWRLPAVPFGVFMRGYPASVSRTDVASLASDSENRAGVESASGGSVPDPPDAGSGSATLVADPESTRISTAPHDPKSKPTRQATPILFFCQILRLIFVAGVEFAVYAWAVTRFTQLGVSLAGASALATGFAVGMAVGRFAGAAFTHIYASWYVFVALGAAGTALAAYVPSIWVGMVGFFIAGVGVSCLYPICGSEFTGMPGIYPHRAAAIIAFISGLGALGTPVILGILLGAVGLQPGFAVLLGFYVLLALLPRPAS